jgi:hypothetical protein
MLKITISLQHDWINEKTLVDDWLKNPEEVMRYLSETGYDFNLLNVEEIKTPKNESQMLVELAEKSLSDD